MVFKRLMASMGAGGASVETVLPNNNVLPGGSVQGHITITGGQVEQEIEQLTVGLVARVEVETDDSEYDANVVFNKVVVGGRAMIHPGQVFQLPFTLGIPFEAPITVVDGHHLHGMSVGVRTELEIARAIDKGDTDPLAVHPLPAQQRILDALGRLGMRFKSADLERGHVRGTQQTLPFYQEIEFAPAPQYAHGMNELEVTFIANPHGMQVVLEADKKAGLFTAGTDATGSLFVDFGTFQHVDWEREIDGHLQRLTRRRGIF